MLRLLNCTIIALDWSQSIENQFGDNCGFKLRSHMQRKGAMNGIVL